MDSFSGNCKNLMIGNISPSYRYCEHSLNAPRDADRVKDLKKDRKSLKKQRKPHLDLMLSRDTVDQDYPEVESDSKR